MVEIVALTEARVDDLLAFFDRPDQGFCYCRFWNFEGSNEDWLARDPDANRQAFLDAARAGELRGTLAVVEGEVVGWIRDERTDRLPKLVALGLEEQGPDARLASLLCFSVAEPRRGQGIAAALLDGALRSLGARGVTEVHAYPRPGPDLEAGQVWTGPRPLLESRGFSVVRRGATRWTLARSI